MKISYCFCHKARPWQLWKIQMFSFSHEFLQKKRFRFSHRIEGISKITECFKNGNITLLMTYFTYDCTLNEKSIIYLSCSLLLDFCLLTNPLLCHFSLYVICLPLLLVLLVLSKITLSHWIHIYANKLLVSYFWKLMG